jgi:hypothetical protein
LKSEALNAHEGLAIIASVTSLALSRFATESRQANIVVKIVKISRRVTILLQRENYRNPESVSLS